MTLLSDVPKRNANGFGQGSRMVHTLKPKPLLGCRAGGSGCSDSVYVAAKTVRITPES